MPSVGTVARPPGVQTSDRRTVGAVFFVHGLLFASWAAHIPHVKARVGLSDGGLGLVLLATPVGSIAAMAVGAWLLPRVGSRRMVAACLVGYCCSGPFVGVATSPAGLFVALLCWGAFQGTLDVSMNTQAVAYQRAAGRPIMSGMHGRWSLGALAGAGAGAIGVGVGISLTVQLAVLGAAALPLVAWALRLPDGKAGPGRRTTPRTAVAAVDPALAESRAAAGRHRVRLDAVRGRGRRLVRRLPAQLAGRRSGRGEPGLRVLHGGDGRWYGSGAMR